MIRSYYKSEIAQMYNPQVSPSRALQILREWILQSPGLAERLKATGYRNTQKLLTPRQVQLIFDAFGEP